MTWIEKGGRYSGYWCGRETTTQKPPFLKPLPYLCYGGSARRLNHLERGPIDIRNSVPLANGFGWKKFHSQSANKALNKLYDQMEQAESLRVAWLEREKAIQMVTSGVRTIVRIARAIKKRDPRIIRAIIGRDPKLKDSLKTPADIWLAYHFGIVPTILDIHHGLGIFAYDPPVMELKVKATYSAPTSGDSPDGIRLQKDSCVLGGTVTSFDANVSLASRLGFGQPLSVAWEMTPFSWFVDYFVNVGEFIKNLEPRFPGFAFADTYTTHFVRYANTVLSFEDELVSMSGFYVRRTGGWPSYSLSVKSPANLKPQQLSYIAAVAVQLLTSMKKKSS